MKKSPQRIIRKIGNRTEKEIDKIMARESRSFPLFLKKIKKPELKSVKKKIREIVEVYPPKLRPFIMTWLVVAYFSIIPGAGTLSLLLFGTIGKYIKSKK